MRKKFKLIKIDNEETKGNECLGETDFFEFNGNVFYFCKMRSSKIKKIVKKENIMTVLTQNSLYTFKED